MIDIRDAVESDFESILRLNDAEVQRTSPMSLERLRLLVQMSSYCKVAVVGGVVAAFLIALPDDAPYENDNFGWFSQRLLHFIYVDRIVVGVDVSGLGIGTSLYTDLFAFARACGADTIACEYDIDPPNLTSRAFHSKFGFHELGTQWVSGGTKKVSLQAADI